MVKSYIEGYPTDQAQMAEYQKKYKFDPTAKDTKHPTGRWYDPSLIDQAKPTTTLKTIEAGITKVAGETKALTERVKTEGITTLPVDPNEGARNDAADLAQQNSKTIFDNIPTGDDVDMRDSSKIIKDIEDKLAETAEKIPAPTSLVDLFKVEKEKLGIEPLDQERDDLLAEKDRLQAELFVEQEKAGEVPVSTREIGRAKTALQKRFDREMLLLDVEISAVERQLSNKYDSLEMIMSFTQQDFENTSSYYTKQYDRTLKVYDMFLEAEEREETREEKATKTALANWDVVTSAMKENGIAYEDLTEAQKLKLTQLEIQGGLQSGTSESVLQVIDSKKEVLTKTYSKDKTQLTVAYEDGTYEVFGTGITPEEEEGEDEPTEKDAIADMKAQLMTVRGDDGYISPEDYKKAKDAWFKAGWDKDEFDKEFEMFANPSHIGDYEIPTY